MAGGTAIYLVRNRLDVAHDIEELIERIGHEAVAENLNDAVMNSTNSEVSSEEPEFVWTVLCQTMTQKSVRKADTNRTDQDSEDHKCFSCVTVRMDDRVINVEFSFFFFFKKKKKKNMIASDHWRTWTRIQVKTMQQI